MLHDTELIGTLTAGLVAAFAGGFIAQRLGLSPIVGYLLAGVAVGPFTPGYEADAELAQQIAEIGVILLMFGVGLHFSVRDLLSVRGIALPGAALQIAIATTLATGSAMLWGWSFGEGLVLGLSISVASTVVLLRALEGLHSLTSPEGKIAVGWLIVEDLFTVLVLVALPVLAPSLGGEVPEDFGTTSDNVFLALLIAAGKFALLGAIVFVVGARVVPWLLMQVARSGSRELFTLAVLAGALGIAFGSAVLFDVSLALGAFMAGLIVAQSAVSHQAASDALPFQDAFAVLFFVSVGMLFDPGALLDDPGQLVVIVAIVIVAKAAVALFIVLLLRYPLRTGLVVAAGLAQVGEFSFILAGLGEELQLLPESGNNLILGAALISISLNPFMFAAVGPVQRWLTPREHIFRRQRAIPVETLLDNTELNRHAVVIGLGNVGQSIVSVLSDQFDVVAAERDIRVAESFGDDVRVVVGDATSRYVLEHLGLSRCVVMILTIPDPFSTQLIIERAREIRPNLDIVARALNEEQAAILRAAGASETVMPEREAALEMIRHSLQRFGIEQRRALAIVQRLRRRDWTGGAGLD